MRTIKRSVTILICLFCSISSVLSNYDQLSATALKYEESGELAKSAEHYYKAGMDAWENSARDIAIGLFEKSVGINQRLGNKNALFHLYTNIGTIQVDMNQLESALFSYRKSLKIRQEMGDKSQIVSGQLNIASVLQEMGRNFEAIAVTEEALSLAKQISNIKLIRSCYGVLAENYKAVGESAQSMEYYNLFATFDKKIQAENIQRKEADAQHKVTVAEKQKNQIEQENTQIVKQSKQTQEDLQKTEANLYKSQKISREQESIIKLKNAELKVQQERERQQIIMNYIYAAGLTLVVVSSLILILAYRKIKIKSTEINMHKEIIQKKNLDIHNSLNYAKKIQRALLLPQSMLNDFIPESFIFFHPREEVSGDFYYFGNANYLRTGEVTSDFDELIISAVDCTGHGVPGAFMSMIGFNLLDNIISGNNSEPNIILDMLNDGVRKSLKQSQTDNKDGMDMALLRILPKERKVQFSGAKNPVVYIQDGILHEIKACRSPIGGATYRGHEQFAMHEIDCPIDTHFYIFSDGFQDQFGGPDGHKFLSKNFKKLLLDIHLRSMSEQKQLLESTLLQWRGDSRQIDDILVIGFKF